MQYIIAAWWRLFIKVVKKKNSPKMPLYTITKAKFNLLLIQDRNDAINKLKFNPKIYTINKI